MYSRNYPENRWGPALRRSPHINDERGYISLNGRYKNRNSYHYPDGEYYSDDWNENNYGESPRFSNDHRSRNYRSRSSSYNSPYDSDIYESEFVRPDPDRVRRYYNENRSRSNRRNYRNEYQDNDYRSRPYYNDEERYPSGRRQNYHRNNFFERAADRIRRTWHDWTGRDNDYVRRYPKDERRYGGDNDFVHHYPEDHDEHHYGRDNWALNRNRGYATRQNRRYKELAW
jgi:hypothetical protein